MLQSQRASASANRPKAFDFLKIEVYQGTHVTRLAIKLLALTFVRTSELIEAKWSEFDLEASR